MMAILANLVVAIHVAYIGFVVLGLAAILIGAAAGWRWVRNLWFRAAHLAAIALVLFESLAGVACPLTTIENSLRIRAAESGYAGSFIGHWLDRLIFYHASAWVFIALYAAFTLVVALTFWLVPPRTKI